jgi:RHS repeat-associated protein
MAYGYDVNGNVSYKLVNGQADLFTFDHENRLTTITRNGVVLESYIYDADGQRVKKTVGATSTYYFFPHYEVSGDGVTTTITKYYFFAGMRIAMRTGSTLYYLHGDHLGSTSLATDSSGGVGNPVRDQGYYAYGRYRRGGTLPTDHKFTGQKLDGSGLYYYGARYYDPQIGLFLSADTLVPDPGVVFDYNRYMYARGNPMRLVDPTGHCPAPPASMGPALCVALFIQPDQVQAGPFTLQGDGRTFDSDSDPSQSRGYAWISLNTDQVETHMNPSTYIFPASVVGHEAYLETEASTQNQWVVNRGEHGEITVQYNLVVSGPLEQTGTAPHINGSITFRPDSKGNYTYAFERDGFPWAEAYYHDGQGGVQTIFQDSAVNGDPFDLFAIEPDLRWYKPIVISYIFQRVQQGRPPAASNTPSPSCQPGSPC